MNINSLCTLHCICFGCWRSTVTVNPVFIPSWYSTGALEHWSCPGGWCWSRTFTRLYVYAYIAFSVKFTQPKIELFHHQGYSDCVADTQKCYRTRIISITHHPHLPSAAVLSAPELSNCAACLISKQLTVTIRFECPSPDVHIFPILIFGCCPNPLTWKILAILRSELGCETQVIHGLHVNRGTVTHGGSGAVCVGYVWQQCSLCGVTGCVCEGAWGHWY